MDITEVKVIDSFDELLAPPDFASGDISAEIAEVEFGFLKMKRKELIYHLGDWEGPIALLYELITRSEIDVKNLFLSKVVVQYVDIVLAAEDLDSDYAGEFLVFGSRLLYFKSKRLMPDEEFTIEDEQEEKSFLASIEEYKLIKDATEKLRLMETTNRFYREPGYDREDYILFVKNLTMEKLVDAYAIALNSAEHRASLASDEPKIVYREEYTVADRYNYIYRELLEKRRMTFFEMFDEYATKTEVINTFLAILELLKRQFITASQDKLFGDMMVNFKESGEAFTEITEEEMKNGES